MTAMNIGVIDEGKIEKQNAMANELYERCGSSGPFLFLGFVLLALTYGIQQVGVFVGINAGLIGVILGTVAYTLSFSMVISAVLKLTIGLRFLSSVKNRIYALHILGMALLGLSVFSLGEEIILMIQQGSLITEPGQQFVGLVVAIVWVTQTITIAPELWCRSPIIGWLARTKMDVISQKDGRALLKPDLFDEHVGVVDSRKLDG